MSISIAAVLDTRRIKKKGTYPVKLRVTHDRESQHYPIIYDLSLDDYEKLGASRLSPTLQKIRDSLKKIEREGAAVIDEMSCFSFSEFELNYIAENPLFVPKKPKKARPIIPTDDNEFNFSLYVKKFPILKEDLSKLPANSIAFTYLKNIKTLIEQGRIGSALHYQDSYNSLKKFKGDVTFNEIDDTYLYKYEKWMIDRGRSKSTVGIKLRPLRAIFNIAMDDKIVKRDKYPFSKRKYQIPTSRNTKKSLGIEDVSSIYYYEASCENEDMARDFWLFFYFANGMNPKDVALLKNKYIDGDFFNFERAKTIRTARSNPKLVTVHITEDMWRIIGKWRNKCNKPDSYLFPILEPGLNPLDEFYTIRRFVHLIDEWMIKIGNNLGLKKRPTPIVARHTFSTVMKRSGASTEFIQEALGHHDKKTTENYLDSFENEQKKEFSKKLSSFKKVEFV